MKKLIRRALSLITVALLIASTGVSTHAAAADITFRGVTDGFELSPGSGYTATDLFPEFKNIMPGDRLSQTVNIKNAATDCDYVKFYIQAVPHSAANPLSYSESFEAADGKDQAGLSGQRDETEASMQDFLSQLEMRIYNGSMLIFEAAPGEAGGLTEKTLLGQLSSGGSLELKVELDVPIGLGNEYAARVGEVDWVISADCFSSAVLPVGPGSDNTLTVRKLWDDDADTHDPVSVQLLRGGKAYGEPIALSDGNSWTYTWTGLGSLYSWSAEEIDVPAGYTASYARSGSVITITNTAEPSVPVGPKDPDVPTGPDVPTEPEKPAEPVSLRVVKKWAEDEAAKRPSSVQMTLYSGTDAVETVWLGEWNGWSYRWTGLDGSAEWSVLESAIPRGYTPSYSAEGDTVTITNTAGLLYTGQLNWPVPVLGGLGALLLIVGALILLRRRKAGDA